MEERTRLSLAIDEALDVPELDRIAGLIKSHPDPAVRPLLFKAINRKISIARMQEAEPATPAPTSSTSAFATAYGLPTPSGMPLYRYRLSDDSFDRLQADLAAGGGYSWLESGFRPGLFVLWAAEWFRRSYLGGGHQWADLVQALGLFEDQARLRRLTGIGLRQWRRDVFAMNGWREYLGSLAREGGFPVEAVKAGARGWARDMLAGIVAPLLAHSGAGLEQARALARGRREKLPKTFQDDEFILLCADLALAVVTIRRESDAPARAAGMPLAAWLSHYRPGWKDELPLAVDGEGAEALLGALLTVEATAVGGAGIGAQRLLMLGEDGAWYEAVRITLDGPVDGQVMRGIDPLQGRLRVFAAAGLARAVPGELAMLDPPGQDETAWTARSSKRARTTLKVDFSTAIECDLRSGEHGVARIMLPGGKPRRGQLIICTISEGDAETPLVLKVEGSGSGMFVAETVMLQVPAGWQVEAKEGETVTAMGSGVGHASLWRVVGGAIVTDDSGDCYRIRTGQARDRRDRLEIDDHPVRWARTEGDVDLFAGPPRVRAGDRTRGSLFIRPIGARGAWRPAPDPLPVGHYEIGWREGPLLLDRRRLAVIPPDASVLVSGRGREARWTLKGWTGASLTPHADAPVRAAGSIWTARPVNQAIYWFTAEIGWPNAPALAVRIAFPSEAAIARWDGALLPADAGMTLVDMRDLVAINQGRMVLLGELIERGSQRDVALMRWEFTDEMPMGSIAADVASLLLPASNDAKVRLGMLDGIETFWDVRPFPIRLQRQGNALVPVEGVIDSDVEICGRAFVDPAREVSFGPYSLIASANHRPISLPPGSAGDWMVYLRKGTTVFSRPEILMGDLPVAVQSGPLAKAMAIPPWQGLTEALNAVLSAAAGDDPAAESTIGVLLSLACSLHGLPPSSFEVLRLLPAHPAVLTRMLVTAPPGQLDAVMALSDALPFAWCTIPKICWDTAGARQFDTLLAQLSGIEGAMAYAMQAMAELIARIAEREPLLAPVLMNATSREARCDIAMQFVRRVIDGRASTNAAGSRYRRQGLPLPADHLKLPDIVLEWLDTPYAAALAVRGHWTPGADDVRHIKTVARNFPTFFADAFAASLKEVI